LGLPWLEKHNPIIDWTEKTLQFRNSQEDKAKAFIRSLAQEQEETTLIEDKDLVVWYLKSHRGPEPSDQLYTPFEDIGRWNEEQPDIAIRKYSPAQQMEHKYNAKQEESILPTQYLPWKEVFEQKAAERFPGKRPWDHAIELRDNFKPKKGKIYPLNPLQQNTLVTYYRTPQRLTARQARWWTNLSQYNYQLIHIPGAKLIQADALSRHPDHTKGEEDDELVTMLPKEQFISLIATDLRDQIQTLSSNNDFIKGIIKCLKERSTLPLRTALSDWTLDDGIILFKTKVFVPNNKDIRQSIIAETHESPVSGHPGHLKTLYLLKERFYWPGMAIMTKQFIDGCAVCQQMKTNTHPTAAPLMPIKSHAHRPFQQVTMDFITDLPISNGFDSIFIVVDQGLSKGVILCPCNKTIDAEGTTKLYIDNVFIQYGLPDVIISDRGPQFASNVFNGIFDAIGVKHRMSTAYHPQTDGQTERYNQELEAYLRIYCTYRPDEWSSKLSLAQFAHNARTHEAIKQSPFQLMYGTKPIALPEVSEKTNSPVANDRINQLYKLREEALAAHDLARVKMMERTTNRTRPFKVNDRVWLESKNLKIPYQSRKLAPKREGPFKIKEVLGPVTYRLTLPKQWKIHDVFHACLLMPYKETELHGPNETRPPPDLIEGQEEYKIEAIISHRLHKNRETTYLIKWKGYNSSENSWISESELTNAEEELNAYKERSNLQ
jgi:hypothetical protein